MKKIAIVGSINMDLVGVSSKFPKEGETITGERFFMNCGGKGANNAVACARLGGDIHMFGCVGEDMFSSRACSNLAEEGVDGSGIKVVSGENCGIALISLVNGNNSISVFPGANDAVSEEYVEGIFSQLKDYGVVGTQLEIPFKTVSKLAKFCNDNAIPFVLNPSPAINIAKSLIKLCSYIIVNETEIAYLEGYNELFPDDVLKLYANKVILTKGKEGVFYCNGEKMVHIPAIRVKRVDTTGAGDTFMGAFMYAIASNQKIEEAVIFANIAAGIKVTKLGAQTGMPYLKEIKEYLKSGTESLSVAKDNKEE